MSYVHPIANPLDPRRYPDMRETIDLLKPADKQRLLELRRLAAEHKAGGVYVSLDRDGGFVFTLNRHGMPTGYGSLDELADVLRTLGVDPDPAVAAAERQRASHLETRVMRARARAVALKTVLHQLDAGPGRPGFMVSRGGSSWTSELADIDAVEAWLDRMEQGR